MTCDDIRDDFGPYLDGEAPPLRRAAVEAHVTDCSACAAELETLKRLTARLTPSDPVAVPDRLWTSIASRLPGLGVARTPRRVLFRLRPTLATAASLLLVASVCYFLLNGGGDGASRAEAATVNFSIMLDALPVDPQSAFRNFIELYQGREASAAEVKRHARKLNFDIPDTLPGGFRLQAAYALRIGGSNAAAARYSRNGEMLGAIFHRPVHPEEFGTHKDYACVVGKHRGHKVTVNDWSLVHLTDATTCHCVLSKLDEKSELPAVLLAVSPGAGSPPSNPSDNYRRHP